MDSNSKAFDEAKQGSFDEDKLLAQYGVGSSRFAGSPYALYERHLKFDNVVELEFVRRTGTLRSRRPHSERHSLGALAAHK